MKGLAMLTALYVSLSGMFMFYHFFKTFHITSQPFASDLHKRGGKNTGLRIQSWNLRNAGMPGSQSPSQDILTDVEAQSIYYKTYIEQPWSLRKDELIHQVLFFDPDIFAVQEALEVQVKSIADGLKEYSWVGVGRDDNGTLGEYEAVFFKRSVLKIDDWETFWLTETPDQVSKYPGAGSTRDATLIHFEIQSTGSKFTLINTHFDDKSDEGRRYGASLIKHRAAYELENNNSPVILVGDFNSEASGDTSGAFKILTGQISAVNLPLNYTSVYNTSIGDSFVFTDLYTAVDFANRLGHYSTVTGFNEVGDSSSFQRIDFHMGSHRNSSNNSFDGWSATRNYVPHNFPDVKYHLSDHNSVITDIILY